MVGSAVDTMVWSRAARVMPSMSAPRMMRTRRCSAAPSGPPPGAAGAISAVSVAIRTLQVCPHVVDEAGQQAPQLLAIPLAPVLEHPFEPTPASRNDAGDHALTGRRQMD